MIPVLLLRKNILSMISSKLTNIANKSEFKLYQVFWKIISSILMQNVYNPIYKFI